MKISLKRIKISKNNYYDLIFPLSCKLKVKKKIIILKNNTLGIYAYGKTIKETLEEFGEEFDFIYNRYNELSEEKLTENVKIIKRTINTLVNK